MTRARRHFCHEGDHRAVFWKVVPSGEGAGGQRRPPASATTVESRESAGVPRAPPVCSLGCFNGQFCRALLLSGYCRHQQLAVSLTHLHPPLPGFPRARGTCCQSWIFDRFIKCALSGPGFQGGRGHRLSGRKQPVSPQMGLCVSTRGWALCPLASHSPLSTRASPRRWQWAQGHCTSFQDLINPVAWEAFLSPPHTPHPPGGLAVL